MSKIFKVVQPKGNEKKRNHQISLSYQGSKLQKERQ